MNKRIFWLLMVGVLLIVQTPIVLAQGAQGSIHEWSTVQTVAADERLIVIQKDGKTIEGKMIEASDTNLTLSRNNKVLNIPRDSIRRIQVVKGKAAKSKWSLIGAGIGGGAGAGLGATQVSSDKDDSEIWIPVGLAFGAGVGAVTGLLIGANQRKRTLIYEAP
jgi:hypothetical protein